MVLTATVGFSVVLEIVVGGVVEITATVGFKVVLVVLRIVVG